MDTLLIYIYRYHVSYDLLYNCIFYHFVIFHEIVPNPLRVSIYIGALFFRFSTGILKERQLFGFYNFPRKLPDGFKIFFTRLLQ